MNVQKIAQNVAGKPRTAQRAKLRRLMGSTYNHRQKKWKDTPQVKEFLKLADNPPTTFHPAKEGPIQKYAIGCNINYTFHTPKVHTGQIRTARFFFNINSRHEEIEYLVLVEDARTYWVNQSNVVGLAD